MRRTIWEWLGIEETTDKARIKKAYAAQAKKYHPEEFPQEAQALREAYKDAMALASAPRAVPARVDGDIIQAAPPVGREMGYVFAKPTSPSPPPESDSKSEPGYVFARPTPSGPPAVRDSEPDPEYIFAKPTPPGPPPVPDSETAPGYVFAESMLVPDRAERISGLKRQLVFLYESPEYRRFPKEWKRAFADYPVTEDLKDSRAVWELFTVIEPMSRLEGPVWEVLQKELFRYRQDTAPWLLLQERFEAVRRTMEFSPKPPAKEPPAKEPPKRTTAKEFWVTFIAMILVGLFFRGMKEVQEWTRQQERMEKQLEFQREVGEYLQMENQNQIHGVPISVAREAFQTIYTKESPCEIDLDRDGMPDHIYYDPDMGLFMVELYDASTDAYYTYGSIDQYLEDHPEMYSMEVLSYFTSGGNASSAAP